MKIPAVFSVLPNAHSPACSFHRLDLSPAPCFINSAINTLTIEPLKQRSHVANSQCLIETKAVSVVLSMVLHKSGPDDEPETMRYARKQMEEMEKRKKEKSKRNRKKI
jgi:mannitol-specific phosphotransferase system IIBC component